MLAPIELLKESWSVFAKHPKLYISIYAVAGVLSFFINLFSAAISSGDTLGMIVTPLRLVTLVVTIITSLALIKAIADPEHTTFKSAYKITKTEAIQYLVVSLLVVIPIFIGFAILIVPGLVLGIWLIFTPFVLVFEQKTGLEALKRSKEYTDGRFMEIFIRIGVLAVVILVSSFLVIYKIGTFTQSSLIMNLLLTTLTAVLMPLSIIYTYLLYKEIKSIGPVVDTLSHTNTNDTKTESETETNRESEADIFT